MSDLEAKQCTVAELFADDAVYTIPIYQRNYAWEAQQIEQLIADVWDACKAPSDSYFLGNLIVTRREGKGRDFEVIDGQQRLTTLYLLLRHLATFGEKPDDTYRDRLRYESRPRSTESLRRLSTDGASSSAPEATTEDAAIHEGFNIIGQALNKTIDKNRLADYLRKRVTLVRATLPDATDLNRYFEIMNTRGQQLQQVDIVKAKLMSALTDDDQRACFAWIWDACSDMDSYVQMTLTKGNTNQRAEIFGDDWAWLNVADFEALAKLRGSTSATGPMRGTLPLDEALEHYADLGHVVQEEDTGNERFRSTIEFSALLLHVLRIVKDDDREDEGTLDDKRLIDQFDKAVEGNEASWVKKFALDLLRCRNIFDAFILKRQRTANTSDEGDWSLQRMVRRGSETESGKIVPGYRNTFLEAQGTDVEEDGDIDSNTRDVLLLESMLRITYTSPRTMHWITKVLRFVHERNPREVSAAEIANLLRDYARNKVKESFFDGDEPTGFDINRIVFTYLDYLLLARNEDRAFRFSFRNSVEHFYPQHPNEEQTGAAVSEAFLHLLGNLALVSVSANSKFGNSLPETKRTYTKLIATQSPKLHLMAECTRNQGWGDQQVRQHHDEMVELLREDCAPTPESTTHPPLT